MARLTAIVLGSAAGGGLPQWNCRCPVCELFWKGDSRIRPRTQAGLGVSGGDGRWVLINASPDLRQQIERTRALHPRGGSRDSPIEAVVLTGAEIDQIAGLLCLRESSPFTLYATPAAQTALAANPIFDALRMMERRRVSLGERFPLTTGLTAELFAVPGKAPLYLEGGRPMLATQTDTTCGIEIRSGSASLVYVPGAAAVTPEMLECFSRADAILFDGTLYTDDEMLRLGVGEKTGRRMGHMPIDGADGSLRALSEIKIRRIYTHINNTNLIHIADSPERRAVEAAGWEIAEDGMEIVL
jgi:pyrroloquinoline quinone biosynthesis protein B